jgi:hypothetical protein
VVVMTVPMTMTAPWREIRTCSTFLVGPLGVPLGLVGARVPMAMRALLSVPSWVLGFPDAPT